MKRTDTLSAFVTAAMALPGISAQAADLGYLSDKAKVSVNHAKYTESGNRMSVEIDQLSLSAPVGDHYEIGFKAVKDVTSGASPVVNLLDGQGNPQLLLQSGASIEDTRKVYEGSIGYYGKNNYIGFGIGNSKEDDYEAKYANIDYRHSFRQKTTNVTLSAAHSNDDVWNTYNPSVLLDDPPVFNKRYKNEWMIGLSQILNKNTTVQFNFTHAHSFGSLSDPYKKAYVVNQGVTDFRGAVNIDRVINFLIDNNVLEFLNQSGISKFLNDSRWINVPALSQSVLGITKERRPSQRDQWIGVMRLSQYLPSTDSALHLDYRYVHDEWEANSHTVDLKWNKDLGKGWMIAPSVRYYSQNNAYFYDLFFERIPSDRVFSSDYRLAGFGAISTKLALSKTFAEDFTLRLNYEIYDRQFDYQLDDSSKGDALDDYKAKIFSISLDALF